MSEHPVTLHVYDDLRRSRLTTFFRPMLCAPHLLWLQLWTYAVIYLFAFPSWAVALILGRPGNFFQRFFSAYVRYSITVMAFQLMVGNPFPGFFGTPGKYPVELELPPEPERQHRLGIFLRLPLAVPSFVILILLNLLANLLFIPLWLVSLVLGRAPRGLRDLSANTLRYYGQLYAYILLLTGVYPSASPYVGISLAAEIRTEEQARG